jgi:hypothetical protein
VLVSVPTPLKEVGYGHKHIYIYKINELKSTFSVLFNLDENVLTLITTIKNTANTHYQEFCNLTYEKQH